MQRLEVNRSLDFRRPARRRAPRIALAAALFAAACASPPPPEGQLRYVDLLAALPRQELLTGSRVEANVLEQDGDVRPMLMQHPPSRVALADVPEGARCWLRASPTISPQSNGRGDGVEFRASLINAPDAKPFDKPFYAELFDRHGRPGSRTAPAASERGWNERTLALPRSGGRLVLETQPGPQGNRDFDWAGWGAPLLFCEASPKRALEAARPNLIVVSVDTLRADHLSLYGYRRETSPNLDRLAEESAVFTQAFSTAPWTLPSHASLFTGLPPHRHGAGHASPGDPLPDGVRTLAERLGEAGYRTVALTAGGQVTQRNGLARGFESWQEATKVGLTAAMPQVFAALDADDPRPFFLFLHTYDVHGPYAEYPHAAQFRAEPADRRLESAEWRHILATNYHDYHELQRFQNLDEVVAAYDNGIHHVDAQLGRLFARLRETGLDANTLLVVLSDHGETLYDRDFYLGHSFSLRDEEIRIPLIVRLPGASLRARSDALVSLEDVFPLVLEAAGLEPPNDIEGRSPLAQLRGEAEARDAVFGEASHIGFRFARSKAWKVVLSAGRERALRSGGLDPSLADRFDAASQAFDLERDPAENENRFGRDLADGARQLADRIEAQRASAPTSGPKRALTPAEAEQLKALGYSE